LVRKFQGKRPLGRPRHRWEDNTKMELGVTGPSRDCVTLCAPVDQSCWCSWDGNSHQGGPRVGTRQRGNLLVLHLGFGHVA
jgi:hypothetical protein